MSQLTDFEWGRIIGHWEAGGSTHDIADALKHSQSQVTCAIKAFQEEGQTTVAQRSGRPSVLNDHDVRTSDKKNRNNSIGRMPQRVQAVIDPTKYWVYEWSICIFLILLI